MTRARSPPCAPALVPALLPGPVCKPVPTIQGTRPGQCRVSSGMGAALCNRFNNLRKSRILRGVQITSLQECGTFCDVFSMSCGYAFRRWNLSCSRSLTRRCRHSGRTSLLGHPFWRDDARTIMAVSTLAPMPMQRPLPVPACGYRSNTCSTRIAPFKLAVPRREICSSSLLAGVGAVRQLSCAQCLSSRHGRVTYAWVESHYPQTSRGVSY